LEHVFDVVELGFDPRFELCPFIGLLGKSVGEFRFKLREPASDLNKLIV